MSGPKTVEEARKLIEVGPFYSGNHYFGSQGLEGDDICAFIDSDGVMKVPQCIRWDKDGPDVWVKIRGWL